MFLFIDFTLINREVISISILKIEFNLKYMSFLTIIIIQAIFAWLKNSMYMLTSVVITRVSFFFILKNNFVYILFSIEK